ncbi:uncharacterized protein LOC106640244 [Copidosoma floridanum]|uniref:uncharacterized protein LOC106640244 n=1 Tax=Copidosoma floridanum TaxID=29053 RepID=UPI0006C966C1|nr:uncharacterized protein LOC106640244 [Copidosoma floridanum]
MTISYASEVPNGSSFGCFWRILIKWKGSVYKLIWRELLVYLLAYYIINFIYRYALNEEQQKVFERIRYYFGNSSESIPMSFVLGFYVSLVVKRWWEQYKLLPWPDNLALFISAAIPGNDERGRLMRRNIVRYAVLAYVITLQRISLRVKRRFPTLQHIVDVGLMMESEKKIFEMMNKKAAMSKYWMPLVWATNIINRARKEQLITSDHVVQTLLVELSDIRKRLGGLIGYDTVCVPLVYTQVVTLSLYAYFLSALLGRQFIYQSEAGSGFSGKYEVPDMYFPFFTTLQFCFYVGWLKVAEVLINPFGEDDDDIELNWLIDRHIKAAYMIVDEMHEEHPELLKDQYWDEVVPKDLPYTVASTNYRREEPKGSAEYYKVKESDALYANVTLGMNDPSHNGHRGKSGHMQDDVYADYESVDTPLVERRKNWLQRQITRMGSVRSSTTTYSSGGFFSRNRHNSVYSSPETGQAGNGMPLQGGQNNPSFKISLYDRLRRKSIQSQRMAGRQQVVAQTKLNSVPISLKNRPRIPTPDVTKEVVDREQRLALSASNAVSIGAGVVGVIPPVTQTPYQHSGPGHSIHDVPVLQVVVGGNGATGLVLSPIQEKTEGTPVLRPAAAHLAQAVLPQSLKATNFVTTPVALPVTMGQLTRFVSGITTTASPTTHSGMMVARNVGAPSSSIEVPQATLTELSSNGSGAEDDSTASTSIATSQHDDGKVDDDSGFKRKSPILMDPEKLDAVVNFSHHQHDQNDWNYLVQASEQRAARSEPKGRRSTSLPGPPATVSSLQVREDRSNSMPHSLGPTQQHNGRAVPARPDSLAVERLRSLQPAVGSSQPNSPARPRSGSFDQTANNNNNDKVTPDEVLRKISVHGNPSNSPTSSLPPPITPSKRSEVYV